MAEAVLSRSETRKAVAAVAFRLDAEQFASVAEKASRHGLSVGQYARHLTIGDLGQSLPKVRRGPPRDAAELRKIAAHLGKVGSNVNQLAAAANTPGATVDAAGLARALADLATMRTALLKALHIAVT